MLFKNSKRINIYDNVLQNIPVCSKEYLKELLLDLTLHETFTQWRWASSDPALGQRLMYAGAIL